MAAARVVHAVARQEVQRPELIDADAPAAGRPRGIKPADSAVFRPELRVGRVLPGLAVTPAHATLTQDLAQAFQRDRRHDLLGHQVLAQLAERPDAHADQPGRRGQCHLGDLLGDIGHELARPVAGAVPGIPGDGVDAAASALIAVEAMDDRAHPLRRAADAPGDLLIANSAPGKKNDAGVAAVDGVGQLPFHLMQRPAFPRPQRPCRDLVHVWFSTSKTGCLNSRCGEPFYRKVVASAPPPRNRLSGNGTSAGLATRCSRRA